CQRGSWPSSKRAERSCQVSPGSGTAMENPAAASARSALAATSTRELSGVSCSVMLPAPKKEMPTTTTMAMVNPSAHRILRNEVFFRLGSSQLDFGAGCGAGAESSGRSCMTPIIPDSAGPSICDDRPVTATFLIVGEALTDIVVDAGGNRREHPGGSPLNVAVALGRLGHRCHLLTHIGCDERGDAIRDHLAESHVVLTAASTGDHPTSTAAATLDASGAATYEFDLTWDPDPAGLPEQVQAVHASSIAAVLDPGARTVTEVLRRCRATSTISYDPNVR